MNELWIGLGILTYITGFWLTMVGIAAAGAANPPGKEGVFSCLCIVIWPVYWIYGLFLCFWELTLGKKSAR